MGVWSRSWLSRLQALHALEWGNYVAAMPLIRAAADYQAAELLLLQTNASEWDDWLGTDPIGLAPADHATEFRPHAFRAAEILAADPILGAVYRASTALSLPHFQATLLLAGADSTSERILMTFGDRDFHLGLAEVLTGWLLQLGRAQFDALFASDGALATPDTDAIEQWKTRAQELLADDERCAIEPVDREGEPRLLVRNWRRAPGAAKKKILL
jgi:hypothetical protein